MPIDKKDMRHKDGKSDDKKSPRGETVWGAYIPDIMRSYPDLPVRGRMANGRFGPEFRPLEKPRHRQDPAARNWIVNRSYEHVVEAMRETADQAIKEMRSGIARLERFIENN